MTYENDIINLISILFVYFTKIDILLKINITNEKCTIIYIMTDIIILIEFKKGRNNL